jgi:serine/threonine-protein kinase
MTGQTGNLIDSSVFSNDAPRPGDVLAGKYRVESVLGAGGMGVVVLVQHIELSQRMAIKLMMPGVDHDPQAVARFLREARAAAGLQSEHVVRIFDVGTLDTGAPYMVMELLRGEDLSQLLLNTGRLPIREAVDYVLQACHAIAEAHAMGIVHRDLKPSNLFLTRRSDGSALVKVLDFGISKAMNPDGEGQFAANLTATSAVMGSPLYMSPEQVRNAKQVDARADIWSLGVILHELLTGSPAFQADTLPGICAAIIADDPPPLRSLREDAPSELEAVLTRCLEKSVKARFQSTRELMQALRAFASSSSKIDALGGPISKTMPEAGISSRPGGQAAAGSSGRGVAGRAPSSTPADETQLASGLPARKKDGGVDPSLASSGVAVASSHKSLSDRPTERVPKLRRVGFITAGIVALGAVMGLGVGAMRGSKPQPASVASAPEVSPIPAARKTFVLVIDSTPSGADVVEGDRALGSTPMQISIDNDAARADARKLTLRREGFQPYSIVQGPSEDNVRIIASLVPAAAETPTTKAHAQPQSAPHAVKQTKAAPAESPPQPPAPSPPPPPNPPPSDIRLQR